jgi:hypothetical protein
MNLDIGHLFKCIEDYRTLAILSTDSRDRADEAFRPRILLITG